MPPSVMLSCLAGQVATPGTSVSEALEVVSRAVLEELQAAEAAGQLLDVRNPRYDADRFTDRWPEDRDAQRQYIDDLRQFRHQLAELMAEGPLNEKAALLEEMFGEEPARSVIDRYNRELGTAISEGNRGVARSGKIITGAASSAAASCGEAERPRGHRFYGGLWR